MKPDLDHVREDILKGLASRGIAVFRGVSRRDSRMIPVLWDTESHAEPNEFLDVAVALGIKLVVFHAATFSENQIGQAFDKLEQAELEKEEHRDIERTLRKVKTFEGFTSFIDVSFEYGSKTYAFVQFAPWYSDYLEVLGRLDDAFDDGMFDEEEDDDDPPGLPAYFSKN
jgi:hypothetical protein